MVKNVQGSYAFAAKPFGNFAPDPARSDQDGFGSRQAGLVKAGDEFLAMGDPKARIRRQELFSRNLEGGCRIHFLIPPSPRSRGR